MILKNRYPIKLVYFLKLFCSLRNGQKLLRVDRRLQSSLGNHISCQRWLSKKGFFDFYGIDQMTMRNYEESNKIRLKRAWLKLSIDVRWCVWRSKTTTGSSWARGSPSRPNGRPRSRCSVTTSRVLKTLSEVIAASCYYAAEI